jgi:hypothetical protein
MPREKAAPAWALFNFSRAAWRVNFSGCCYDCSLVRIPESAAIIPQACTQHYCQRQTAGKFTMQPGFCRCQGWRLILAP